MRTHPTAQSGFSLPEALVVVATVILIGATVVPYIARPRHHNGRIQCLGNLKQIGLAMRMWSNDHNERFPWHVPRYDPERCSDHDGAQKCGGSGDPLEAINDGNVTIFRAISNELNSPKVLVCSSDRQRQRAQSFSPTYTNYYHLVTQTSYLVGLMAAEAQPQAILIGDRNVTGGVFKENRRTWTATIQERIDADFDSQLHRRQGNVGMADGSATQVGPGQLKVLIATANEASRSPTVLQFPD